MVHKVEAMTVAWTPPLWYNKPMAEFIVGEHIDVHGRRSLYRQVRRSVAGDTSGHVSTWLRWVAYLPKEQ